jgi:hypothetical protein
MKPSADRTNVHRLHPLASTPVSAVVPTGTDVRGLIPLGDSIRFRIPFESDVWNLAGHASWRSKAGQQTTFSFADIPEPWRAAAKEWILLCLDPSLATAWAPDDPIAATWPETQEPVKVITAQANLKALRSALTLLDRYDLYEPDADDWAQIATLMRQPQNRADKRAGATLSPGTLRMRAQQLRSLWMTRTIIRRPQLLGTYPFGEEESTAIFGSGTRPVRNLRRPHEDVGLCLGMIAWVFDHIADDIVAHARWWAENSTTPANKPATRSDGYEAMVVLLDEIAAQHGALPGTKNVNKGTTLAHTALAGLLGETDPNEAFLWGRFAMRRFSHVPLDLTGADPCPLPIKELPLVDGSGTAPWTSRLLNTGDELQWWVSALVYYAMFYIAATCALRDLDLDCLSPNCVSTTLEHRPTGETYTVNTLRGYKQKNRMAPVPTEWKVNARIARIVRLIDELHAIYAIDPSINSHTGRPRLFDSQLIRASKRRRRESIHLDQSFLQWFTDGAHRLHDRGVTPRNLDGISKISVANVRITAIQAYASGYLGEALSAAFGQWSTKATAAGYHGDVHKLIHLADPAEASEARHEHTGRILVRAADRADSLKGNGTTRLLDVAERSGLTIANRVPLSTARLRSLGKSNPNLRTGPYTLCLYQADAALCGGVGAADFRLCRPYECRNSSMTPAHRARIELRRRDEMEMAPILRRSAEKIAAAMPEIIEEFKATTRDELVAIVVEDLEGYIADALGEKRENQ